jgi:hypothetical protein
MRFLFPLNFFLTSSHSDDIKTALVEFISRDKSSLSAIRLATNASGVKIFEPKNNYNAK